MSSFALGPLSNRPPQYQNQYMLLKKDGILKLAAVSRRALASPPETLAEIFLFCLPFHRGGHPIIPNPNEAPLVLCAVCRQWRNIALDTPYLWRSLYGSSREVPPAALSVDIHHGTPRAVSRHSRIALTAGTQPLSTASDPSAAASLGLRAPRCRERVAHPRKL
ncbi:hypothetical protein MSAN_01047400 [Mycena sanguinolenta]|uniref:F-box domain-containing protein n=1 Tax=Mycena sanguinolenta TaxID=230812 RepID=A0A8H7D6A4_9AGAR|nr:hypothetical protein MSAN_01047400 [Mycena sanguinolenta]